MPFFLGKKTHGDQRDEEQPHDAHVLDQRPNDEFIHIHGAARLHLPLAHDGEVTHHIPEEEADDNGEHGEQ